MESFDPTLDNILHPKELLHALCIYSVWFNDSQKYFLYFKKFSSYRLLELCGKLLGSKGTWIAQIVQPHHGFHLKLEVIGNIT